jgi:hypothetical protein
VVEEDSQTVLNTLTEHDFQDAFKIDRNSGNVAYTRKGATSRVIVVSRPKVSFRPDDSTNARNMDGSLCLYWLNDRKCKYELEILKFGERKTEYNDERMLKMPFCPTFLH